MLPLHKVIISIFQFSLLHPSVGAILREFVLFRSRWVRADAAQTDFLQLKYYLWRSDKVERQLGEERATHRALCWLHNTAQGSSATIDLNFTAMNKSLNANKAICQTQIIIRRGYVRTSASSRGVACILNCSCTCTINTRWCTLSLSPLAL